MASIDGNWDVTVNSPMGAQSIKMILKSDGGALSGTLAGAMGSTEVMNGKVDGDAFSFEAKITEPFPINIEVEGTVEGDAVSGKVKTQGFGAFPMKGSRV
jgi:hypothetical protein